MSADERMRKLERDYDGLLEWVQDEKVMLEDRIGRKLEEMHEIYEHDNEEEEKVRNRALPTIVVLLAGIGLGGMTTYVYERRKRLFILKAMEERVAMFEKSTVEELEKTKNFIIEEFLNNQIYPKKEKIRWRKLLIQIIACQQRK